MSLQQLFIICGENNNIIQFSNMGCASPRDHVYEIKHPQFSNRDINETRCDLQAAMHYLPPQACGYEFGINIQNSDPNSSPNKQKAKQQAELDKFSHLMDVYKQMEALFASSRIDQAYHLQRELRQIYNELNFNIMPELESDKKEKMFEVAESVEKAYMQLKLFQKQLLNEQWDQNFKEELLEVKYHRGKDACKVHVEAEVEVCLQLMTATFGSFSRYHQFMKFALSSKQIKKDNIFRRLGEITYDIPFCSQSATYFEEVVIDRLSVDKSIVIGYQSLFKNSKLYERLQFYPTYEIEPKVDFPRIVCKLEPISSSKTKVTLVFLIKGEIEPIADWVIDKLYKNIGVETMKKLIDKAKAFGEETDTEILEGDDQLYHHFHHLIKVNEKKVMD